MGQCFSEPLVADTHGRETEAKYRAKWNDIRDGAGQMQLQQQQRIKTNLQYTTTADVGLKRHDGGYGRYGGFDDQGGELDPIDEYKSLHVPSPLKQSQHHASPMKNAAAHIGSQHGARTGEDQPLGSRQGQSQYQAQSNQTHQSQGQTQQVQVRQQQQLQTPTSWTCGDLIGQGAFGSVYLGMDDDTGHLMAVKQVSLAYAGTASAAKIAEHIKSLEAEVSLLQRLDHPNIVRYLGTERTSKALNIFLEYIPGGSIASLLAKFGPFKESVVKMFTKQILLGLEYLHRNGIMHRDIKGANILVDNTGMVKLADFGASKQIEDLVTIGSGANSVKGTPYWMAPEVITQTGHGRQADIWSVACTVIEMATGKPPWSQYGSQVSAMFHIAKSKGPPMIPEDLSPDCKDFLYLCFNRNWRQRPQASTLLQHPFLAGVVVRSMPATVAPRAPDVVRQSHQHVISAVRNPGELSRGRDDLRMTAVSAPVVEEGTATSPDPCEKRVEKAVWESRVMNESYQARPRRQLNLDAVATNNNGMTNAQGSRRASAGHQEEQIKTISKKPVVRASAPVFPLADRDELENLKRAASSRPPLPPVGEGGQKNGDTKDGRQSISEKSSASQQSSGSLHSSSKEEQGRYASFIMSPNGINAMSLASQGDQSISKSGTSSKQYSSGGSMVSGSSFNPVVEPEGAQQQARQAIDSLKVALAATEDDRRIHSREEQRHSQAASLASSESAGESARHNTFDTCGEANKSTGAGRSAGVSDGPIVYTVAVDASNDSSVPGLPWDAGHSSWSLSSRPMSNTTSSAFNSRSISLSNGQSTGVSKSTVSSKSSDSHGVTKGAFVSRQLRSSSSDVEKSIASEERSFQRSKSGSLSSQSSESARGHTSTSSSCGEELPRRLSSLRSSGRNDSDKMKNDDIVPVKSKEFQTPRRYRRSMSGASTPVGPSPCRIPRPPPYHGPASPPSGTTGIKRAESSGNNMASKAYTTNGPLSMTPRRSLPATPRRNPSPVKRASMAGINGGDCIGTYEQQHLKQLEMKRSGPFAGRNTPSRTPRPADASRYTTPRKREPVSHVSASVSAIPSARKASRTPAPGARSEQQFVIPR